MMHIRDVKKLYRNFNFFSLVILNLNKKKKKKGVEKTVVVN